MLGAYNFFTLLRMQFLSANQKNHGGASLARRAGDQSPIPKEIRGTELKKLEEQKKYRNYETQAFLFSWSTWLAV